MAAGATRLVSPVFVGHESELSTAHEVLDRAVLGESGVLLVTGEGGIGKSRFTSEILRHAEGAGMRVLVGHSTQGGTGLPFAPLVEILRTISRDPSQADLIDALGPTRELFDRLIPTPGSARLVETDVSSGQVRELALGLIEHMSVDQPIVLVFDGLQWADPSTLELVSFLAQNLRGIRVAFIVTYRSDEIGRRHPLRRMQSTWGGSSSVVRLELGRLSRAEVHDQIEGILGESPDPATLTTVCDRSGGNPFFVEEVLAVVRQGGSQHVSESLRDVVLSRTDGFDDATIELLQAVAAAGSGVQERMLSMVTDLDARQLADAVREALDSGILVVDNEAHGYRFRHGLVRDVIYDDMLPGQRIAIHAAFSQALYDEPGLADGTGTSPVAALAYHAYEALDLPKALPASIQAGLEADHRWASREALVHFERAIVMWPRVADAPQLVGMQLFEVLRLAGNAASAGGEAGRSMELLALAVRELPDDVDLEVWAGVHFDYASCLWMGGRNRASATNIEILLNRMRSAGPSHVVLQALVQVARAHMLSGRLAEAIEAASEAVELARQFDDQALEADALVTWGVALGELEDMDEGSRLVQEAIRIAKEARAYPVVVRAHVNMSNMLEGQGLSAKAGDVARQGLDFTARNGMRLSLGVFLAANLAESLMHLGHFREAVDSLGSQSEDSASGGRDVARQAIVAESLIALGDIPGARLLEGRMVTGLGDSDEPQFLIPLRTTQVELARIDGDFDRIADRVAQMFADLDDTELYRYLWPLLFAGIRAEAERVRHGVGPAAIDERLAGLVETLGSRSKPSEAFRELCRAELAGKDAQAWQAAVDVWRQTEWPWWLAYSLIRLAEASQDDDLLQEARRLAHAMGAQPLLELADEVAPDSTARILEKALEAGEFFMVFQPLVYLKDRKHYGYEALIRWQDPVRGLVPPDHFIPDAERTGFVVPLGRWVLSEVLRVAGAKADDSLSYTVNVSMAQLDDEEFYGVVESGLASWGLPSRNLVLEITESVVEDDPEALTASLTRLHDMGARIAMDDFGSGYSTLGRLDSMPIDVVKLDGTFLDRLDESNPDVSVLEGVALICRRLGLQSLVEKVETEFQAGIITDLGFDLGQGWLFSKALTEAQVLAP